MNQNSELEALRKELDQLQAEHERILGSTSYRVGRLLTGAATSPRALLRLPLDVMQLAREMRARRKPLGPDDENFQTVLRNWQGLAERVRAGEAKEIVFLFSGTTHIQDTRGNRPIRQTLALLARGTPVLFSYHRSRKDEPLPAFHADGLVQSPVDITMQILGKIAAADLGGARKLFIISYPLPGIEKSIDMFRAHGWTIVYDCRDDWEEFSKVGMASWYNADVEQLVVRKSDRVFCVSGPLVEKMRRQTGCSHVELMPNAVESNFLPEGYQHNPAVSPKVVGYFGHLSPAWFDWEGLAEIARRRPQYRFEVIGHSAPSMDLPENIDLLGPKQWHQLHNYAARWSAAIIPFRMGLLADGVDPIKIYEYLSFGLPVVSFRMPQIDNYPYTRTVESIDDFCEALDEATETVPDQAVIDAFIARNTWEVRAEELLSVLDHGSGASGGAGI